MLVVICGATIATLLCVIIFGIGLRCRLEEIADDIVVLRAALLPIPPVTATSGRLPNLPAAPNSVATYWLREHLRRGPTSWEPIGDPPTYSHGQREQADGVAGLAVGLAAGLAAK